MGRKASRIAAAVVLAIVLAACQPIQFDADTGQSTSEARWRVRPIELDGHHAIEVRIRNCNAVHITAPVNAPDLDLTWTLHPFARVVDDDGTVFFDTQSVIWDRVQPPGSQVIDQQSEAGVDLIIVPVRGAESPLHISAGCTNWLGYSAAPNYTWSFTSCVTSNRTCDPSQAGSGNLVVPI